MKQNGVTRFRTEILTAAPDRRFAGMDQHHRQKRRIDPVVIISRPGTGPAKQIALQKQPRIRSDRMLTAKETVTLQRTVTPPVAVKIHMSGNPVE